MHSERTPAERRAADIIQGWLEGVSPDAAAALTQDPELAQDKGIVLDLAFAEFLIRERRGETVDPEEFCQRFPEHHASLGRMLAQQSVGEHPTALDAALPDALEQKTINTPVTPVRGTGGSREKPARGSDSPGNSSPSGSSSSQRGGRTWPEAGERVGDFDLLRQLGKGAFGRVFLAVEEPTTRHVVVKLTRQKCDEAKVLGRLGHRNVVSVLSAPRDATSGLFLIVMPYHGSATLEDLLELAHPLRRGGIINRPRKASIIVSAARRNLQVSDPAPEDLKPDPFLLRASFTDGVVWLGIRIAEALSAVHQSGFVHHDLKPSNVLLGLDGQPRVLDFNLASDVRNSKSRLGGTLPYMPPEHLIAVRESDESGAMDARGDIYSLGVILYELLSGSHPFGRFPRKKSVKTVADEMLTRQKLGVRPLRERNAEVPFRLARLIEKCLSFDPDDRPQSAALVAQELRHCYSARKKTMQFLASRPGRVAVTSAAIGLVSAATWMASAQARPALSPNYRVNGLNALADGRYADAIPSLTQASQQFPDDAEVWLSLARAKLAQQEWQSARPDLERAAALRPAHGPTLASLGLCLTKLGFYPEAQKALQQAEESGFAPAGLHALRGCTHVYLRQDRLAEIALNRALELDPNHRAALVNRAQLRLAQAMGESRVPDVQGIEDVERALQAGPPDANVALWAARFHAWLAIKPAHVRGPWYTRMAESKARCLELIRQAAEGGVTESFWKHDSTFNFLLGDLDAISRGWKMPERLADTSGNWRTGDPLVEFAGG